MQGGWKYSRGPGRLQMGKGVKGRALRPTEPKGLRRCRMTCTRGTALLWSQGSGKDASRGVVQVKAGKGTSSLKTSSLKTGSNHIARGARRAGAGSLMGKE